MAGDSPVIGSTSTDTVLFTRAVNIHRPIGTGRLDTINNVSVWKIHESTEGIHLLQQGMLKLQHYTPNWDTKIYTTTRVDLFYFFGQIPQISVTLHL